MPYPVELLNPDKLHKPKGRSELIAFGHYVPPDRFDNNQILSLDKYRGAQFRVRGEPVDLTPRLIEDRTGVLERSFAFNQTAAEMAIKSAKQAIDELKPPRIDILLVSASHPTQEDLTAVVAKKLGLEPRHRMTYHAACSGSALALADSATNGILKPDDWVLLTATEKYSDTLDPKTETIDFGIFGDESVSLLFQARAIKFLGRPLAQRFHNSVRGFIDMRVKEDDMRPPYTQVYVPYSPYFYQRGRIVFELAVKEVPKMIATSLQNATLNPADVLMVYHQGGVRIVKGIAKAFKDNASLADYKDANVSSASVLRAWMKGAEAGYIGIGSVLNVTGFGAGAFAVTQNLEIAA